MCVCVCACVCVCVCQLLHAMIHSSKFRTDQIIIHSHEYSMTPSKSYVILVPREQGTIELKVTPLYMKSCHICRLGKG